MVGRISLVKREVSDGVIIPLDSIVNRESGPVIYLVDECKAREINLEAFAVEGDEAFVETGILAGDRLVVDGQRDLADGQEVISENCS